LAGSAVLRRPRLRIPDPTALVAGATFLLALVVYRATMLPGVGAWDTAEVQTVAPLLGTMHPTGFPAFVLLGWAANQLLAPFGEPAFRMTLLSGILAALGSGLAVFVFRRLGAPVLVAAAAAVGFALTPITWHIGVSADVHALHVALVVAITLGLLRWEAAVRDAGDDPDDPALRRRADRRLIGTAALFGVSVANHGLTLLLAPAVGVFVYMVDAGVLRRPRLVLASLGTAIGVAALLYLELPLRAGPFRAPLVYGHPETLTGLLDTIFARQFQGDVTGGNLIDRAAALWTFGIDQLGPLAVLVLPAFVVTALRHRRYAAYSGTAFLLTCVFAATYENARIDRYYLGPLFFAWSWLAAAAGVLADQALDTVRDGDRDDASPGDGAGDATAGSAAPVRAGVSVVLALVLLVPTAIGLRDRWSAQDLSGSTMAPEWLDQALGAMDGDAVVVSWWSYTTPLWYATLVEGRRPDITIVDDRTRLDEDLGEVRDVIETNIDTRPVYLIRITDGEVDALRNRYAIESVGEPGNLFRVTGRTETPTQ
jgi:4-amino-4-deoxy-L-arabinose transferase-like glycosyltransferase